MISISALRRPAVSRIWLPVAVTIWSATANAQIAQSEQQDLGVTAPSKSSSRSWTLGMGAATMPSYYGSDEYETQAALLIDVQYGRFFAKTGEGIGFNVIKNDRFAAGISVNWMQGYETDDVPVGIDEVKDALGARLFATARFKGAVTTLAATRAVTETERGLLINASLAYPFRPTRKLSITPSLGATWGNDDYMNGYFGIDARESAASGLAAYRPDGAGFRDVSFRVGIGYRITDKITAVGAIGVMHLLDKAADSPLVQRETQPIGLIGFTYTFGR